MTGARLEARLTIPGNHCTVHGYHWPEPLRTVKHHILPESEGGKATPDNLVLVCDTGHYSIHHILDIALATGKLPALGTRKEREIASEGYRRIKAKANKAPK
jgi:hypothetical protein